MKKWKFLLLGAGYLAGLLVALRFGKDGKGKGFDDLLEDVKSVHRNLFSEAEEVIFSEENKAKIRELKAMIIEEIHGFEADAREKIVEWKKLGINKKDDIEDELKSLYARREAIIAELKKKALTALEKWEGVSKEVLEGMKTKVESIYRERIEELEEAYARLKKKLK